MLQKFSSIHMDNCVRLFYDVFTSEDWKFDWLAIDNINRYFTDLGNTPQFSGFVWIEKNRLMGGCFGVVSDYFSAPQYEIKEIFVDLKSQGQGIGSRFLKAIEDELARQEIQAVSLFTQCDIPAYSFYLKNEYIISEKTVHFLKVL